MEWRRHMVCMYIYYVCQAATSKTCISHKNSPEQQRWMKLSFCSYMFLSQCSVQLLLLVGVDGRTKTGTGRRRWAIERYMHILWAGTQSSYMLGTKQGLCGHETWFPQTTEERKAWGIRLKDTRHSTHLHHWSKTHIYYIWDVLQTS